MAGGDHHAQARVGLHHTQRYHRSGDKTPGEFYFNAVSAEYAGSSVAEELPPEAGIVANDGLAFALFFHPAGGAFCNPPDVLNGVIFCNDSPPAIGSKFDFCHSTVFLDFLCLFPVITSYQYESC